MTGPGVAQQPLVELFFGLIIAFVVLRWIFATPASETAAFEQVRPRSRIFLWGYVIAMAYQAVWGAAYVHGLSCIGGINLIGNIGDYVLWTGLAVLVIVLAPILLHILQGKPEDAKAYWGSVLRKFQMIYRASPTLLVLACVLLLFSVFDETVRFRFEPQGSSAYVYDRLFHQGQSVYVCPPDNS
jgi:hypothetical protein